MAGWWGAGERKGSSKKNRKVGFEQLILPENETRGHQAPVTNVRGEDTAPCLGPVALER